MSRCHWSHMLAFAGALAVGAFACSGEKSKSPDRGTGFPPSSSRAGPSHTSAAPGVPTMPVIEPIEDAPVEVEPDIEVSPKPPESFSEFFSEGKRLLAAGELPEAIEHLQRASEMQPKNVNPRIQLARAKLAAGDLHGARAAAEEAVELASDSSFAWNTLGRVELAEKEYAAAIASFQRATDENPDNSYAWNNLGFVYLEQDMYEEAASALEGATSGSNPTAYMWNNLGMAYEHLDLIVEARAAYRQGADAGSAKAESNLERLEGVVSLKVDSEVDGDDVKVEIDDGEEVELDDEVDIP